MEMKRGYAGILLVICLLIASISEVGAATKENLAEKQILRAGLDAGDLGSLDPVRGTAGSDVALYDAIYRALVRFPSGQVTPRKYEPDLAEKWRSSPDGLTWSFNLRKGVKWHRGFGELTAEDVKFSLERNNHNQAQWRRDYENIKEITIVDRHTIQITLKKIDPFFLSKLANWRGGFVLCKKALEGLPKERFLINPTQSEIIGTGPFVFESYTPKDKIILIRNEDFFLGSPIIERVIFNYMPLMVTRELALMKREIDAMFGNANENWVNMMKQRGLVVDAAGPVIGAVLHFNPTLKPLNDVRVRKAICYAIDRNQIVKFLGETITKPMLSPIPNGYYGQTISGLPTYEYDPEKAKRLLEEADLSKGFSLDVFVSQLDWYKDRMIIIQQQLKKVGVNLNLKTVEHSIYHKNTRSNLSPLVLYAAKRFPTAGIYLQEFYHSSSIVGTPTAVTNFSHYDKIDNMIDKASLEMDEGKLLGLYHEAQRKIMEDAAAYPIDCQPQILARQPYVHLGYELKDSLNYFYQISHDSYILKP